METISNWTIVSRRSRQLHVPVVVMVDRYDCPYCRIVESEYFAAILAGQDLTDKALYGKISLDPGAEIRVEPDAPVATAEFLRPYSAELTPTILFLDADARQLVDKMVGLTTPDYYGYYLEQSIRSAWQKLNS